MLKIDLFLKKNNNNNNNNNNDCEVVDFWTVLTLFYVCFVWFIITLNNNFFVEIILFINFGFGML